MKFIGKERAWEALIEAVTEKKSGAEVLQHPRGVHTHKKETREKIRAIKKAQWANPEGPYVHMRSGKFQSHRNTVKQ